VSELATFVNASWQDPSNNALDAARHSDLSPSMFAPGGRLYSVELMAHAGIAAEDGSNNLVAAVLCEEGVVVVASLPESPYLPRNLTQINNEGDKNGTLATFVPLLVPEHGVPRPPFLRLSTDMWAVTAGNSVDSQLLRLKLHRLAESIREEDQSDRADVLARRLADNLQLLTQQEGHGRILAAYAVIFTDKEIWRVDPTGQFWKCHATLIGRDCTSAESKFLSKIEKREKDKKVVDPRRILKTMDKDEALALCRDSISETFADMEKLSQKDKYIASSSTGAPLKGLWVSKRDESWFSMEKLCSLKHS